MPACYQLLSATDLFPLLWRLKDGLKAASVVVHAAGVDQDVV